METSPVAAVELVMGSGHIVELHAAGLGLMLYSPGAVTDLEDGHAYMPVDSDLSSPLRELVERTQRVVLLGTGSPQLDYVVHVRDDRVPLLFIGGRTDRGRWLALPRVPRSRRTWKVTLAVRPHNEFGGSGSPPLSRRPLRLRSLDRHSEVTLTSRSWTCEPTTSPTGAPSTSDLDLAS